MADDAPDNFPPVDRPDDPASSLRRELQERDDLLALLAHELRNPLHTIQLQLELARIGCQSLDKDEALAKLNKVRASLQRYSGRVTVLLDLIGRKEGYPAQPKPIELGALLTDVAENLRLEAGYHRIALRYEAPRAPIHARLDPVVLEQIIENLLLNAFKHSGGTDVVLSLRSFPHDGWIEVEIQDNGRGISAEDHDRIFGKHEVGRKAGRLSGTGLGLWIVRRLGLVLGATIALDSAEGAGCRFTVRIPILPSSSSTQHPT